MPRRCDWIVYVVDDDDDVRDSTQELLQCVGFEVRGFASAREFLQHFDPAVGLCIILDLHMPDISGFQVLDVLQARGSTVPIIIFSGRSDHTTEEFAHRSGVIAVLGKPMDADRLIDLIQGILSAKAAA
ncbi:MAG: response regulator [Rhizomicrobium sp.]|nr:response regulator [Rhizomicrobium sp.]